MRLPRFTTVPDLQVWLWPCETCSRLSASLMTISALKNFLGTDYMNLPQILGFVGTGLVALAYIPQIYHLINEHCSAGISIKAYALWFLASVLFLIHAAMI